MYFSTTPEMLLQVAMVSLECEGETPYENPDGSCTG